MAAIDMPATPANPSTYKASNGVTYVWDGQKWSATGSGDISSGISVGVNAPASPDVGNLWYNTSDGIMYVWYVDASQSAALGEGQWVDTRPGND